MSGAYQMNGGAGIRNDSAWDGPSEAEAIKLAQADDGSRKNSTHPAALVTRYRALACREDRTADKRCCKRGRRTAGNSRW